MAPGVLVVHVSPSEFLSAEFSTFQRLTDDSKAIKSLSPLLFNVSSSLFRLRTGELSAVGELQEKDGCGSFLAMGFDGFYLYSVAAEGAAAFEVAVDGTLKHLNTVKCHVAGAALGGLCVPKLPFMTCFIHCIYLILSIVYIKLNFYIYYYILYIMLYCITFTLHINYAR